MAIYAEDTFFNLTMTGRIGLAALSLVFALVVLMAAARAFALVRFDNRTLRIGARLAMALALFWAFEWLSPQIYYLYYLTIFDGLPWQIVVQAPPGVDELARLLGFADKAALSHHARGLLAWALIALALFWRR